VGPVSLWGDKPPRRPWTLDDLLHMVVTVFMCASLALVVIGTARGF
jgi:hypothetical protein